MVNVKIENKNASLGMLIKKKGNKYSREKMTYKDATHGCVELDLKKMVGATRFLAKQGNETFIPRISCTV